jgi:hypothetical protein
VCVTTTDTTTNPGACTSNQAGQSFSFVQRFQHRTSLDQTVCYVSNYFATAVSQTVTYACTGDAATGAIVVVLRIAGMTRTGLSAIRQSAGQTNQAAASTPAPAFSAAALTGNACIGFFGNASNVAGRGVPPTSWTERYDATGYTSPAGGIHVVSINSGFTGTTVTWGGTSATAYSSQVIELDGSGQDILTVPPIVPAGW